MTDRRGTPLTRTEAAQLAGVQPHTITMWVKRGHLAPAGTDSRGRPIYWSNDVAAAEKVTRKSARRNVGLRTVATQDIADEDAVLVRLTCRHLKILTRTLPLAEGRTVACFECSAQSAIDHLLRAPERVPRAA